MWLVRGAVTRTSDEVAGVTVVAGCHGLQGPVSWWEDSTDGASYPLHLVDDCRLRSRPRRTLRDHSRRLDMAKPLPFTCPSDMPGLRVVKVLEYWDRDLLLVLEGADDLHCLAVLVDDDRAAERWLVSAIDRATLTAVVRGEVDYYSAFTKSHRSLLVTETRKPRSTSAEVVTDLALALLPKPGLRFERDDNPGRGAVAVEATVTLDPGAPAAHAFPLRALGNVLRLLQGMLDASAAALSGHRGSRGAYPRAVIDPVQMHAVAVFPSSFGVSLKRLEHQIPMEPLLEGTGQPLVVESLKVVTDLLRHGADEDKLSSVASQLSPRLMNQYGALVSNLRATGSGLKLAWHSSSGAEGDGQLDRDEVDEVATAVSRAVQLSAETLIVEGELTKFDKGRRTFIFESSSEGEDQVFRGHLAKNYAPDQLVVGAEYVAELRSLTTTNPTTLDEKVEYFLLGLTLPDSP